MFHLDRPFVEVDLKSRSTLCRRSSFCRVDIVSGVVSALSSRVLEFEGKGKLPVLPANVRLDWKKIARYKHSILFGLIICNEEFFMTLTPGEIFADNLLT